MEISDPLYDELRPEFQQVASPLLKFSMECIKKRGNFLPHGAALDADGKVQLSSAVPDSVDRKASAADVLPLLHEGMRSIAQRCSAKVVGVAESVTIALTDHKASPAIKVLLEHRRGMTVAVYVTFKRKVFGGYVFEKPFTIDADPEIAPWSDRAA